MSRPSLLRTLSLVLLLFVMLAVLAGSFLFWVFDDTSVEVEPMDRVALDMPFDPPRVDVVEQLAGITLPTEAIEQNLKLKRAFFAGDFEYLDQALNAQRQAQLSGSQGSVAYNRFAASLKQTALAGLDRCQQWLQAMPESYAAHWICAEVWNNGAWDVRSERRMRSVSFAQISLMDERLNLSNRLLERAITLDEVPVEALNLLAENHFLLGTGLHATYFNQAMALFPRYLPLHRTRANFLQPRWGGSDELVQESIEQARLAGIAEPDLLDMTDDFLINPAGMSSPGATRAYWEGAISQQPTQKRLIGLMHDFARLQNWKALVPAAEAVIASYPDDADAYYWLAQARKMMGHMPEARAAFLSAAAMGQDDAMQELIMAFIRGGLGIDEHYQGAGVVELCGYSAALGSPIGANCLGAGSFEGGQPGVPFAHDPAQGYAWHLLAARAGHYNSQFDLGWMLYTGRVPGVEGAQAQELGIFWLRRAAEKNHVFAGRRLDEMNISRSESAFGGNLLLALKNTIRFELLRMRQQWEDLWALVS